METLTDLLARAIAEQNLSHTAAALRLGVTRQTLYGWLRGQTPSQPKHIDAIVGFTGEDKLHVLLVTGWISEDDLAGTTGGVNGHYHPVPMFGPTSDLVAS